MPITVSSEGSERVVVLDNHKSRNSSRRSVSIRSPTVSSSSGRYSGSTDSDWSEVGPPYEDEEEDEEDDDIEPSDSASRSRHPPARRHTAVEPRPAPVRRHSSRRVTTDPRDEPAPRRHTSRRHTSSRHRRHESQRVPSDGSASTVASSHDDWPGHGHYGGGAPMPPQPPRGHQYPPSGYRHVPAQGHGGFPGGHMTPGGYQDPFAAQQQQALVQMPPPQTDAFGYPSANPFSPGGGQHGNPFSPMSSSGQTSYFGQDPHAQQMGGAPQRPPHGRPQSYAAPSQYGSEMAPYQPQGMHPYGGYGMPPPGMQGMMPYQMGGMPGMHGGMMPPWYPPPSHGSPAPAPAPAAEKEEKKEKGPDNEAMLALLQKHEDARIAWEREWIAKREEEAAKKAAEEARAEEEKKRKQELADATAKAKKEAEEKAKTAADKAKEDHAKKLKEAETAKEEAEKKQKELEEAAAKGKPPPDTLMEPIKFKDAVGRKFSFPFHLCKTWKGMEGLIKQAFLHVDVIGEHVHMGHYDLTGPDGEIILPQVWDTMIRPDWEITMHMWPMPEPEPDMKDIDTLLNNPMGDVHLDDDLGFVQRKPKREKSKKSKKHSGHASDSAVVIDVAPDRPPPPNFIPGLPDPISLSNGGGDERRAKKGARAGSKSSKEVTGMMGWFAGASARPPKKDDEKSGSSVVTRQKSASSSSTTSSKHAQQQVVACAVM